MENDLNNKEFYNDMLKEMVKYISSSKTEMSVMQVADSILHEYIKRTEHHIWLVGQCAGVLKDVLVDNGQDVAEFMSRVEYHDYDKLHNPKIIPVYAVACDYYYGDGKAKYEVYEEDLHKEFEDIAWPEHHRANDHHVAEHYGRSEGKDKPFIVPTTSDYLAIGEMIADWMAMSVTHGDSAREWYKKTKGVKWTFSAADDAIIEKFLKAEDEAHNQLAYLRQFKTWEVSTVAMQQVPTISEDDPQEINGVNEGIENFQRELDSAEDKDLKDTLYIEPIEKENLVADDESSELDKYIEEVSKLVAQMEPMELKHKLGKYDDDELAIGKISDKNINMDIVNELMKYPRYLEVLKHWITVPDYTLLPDLARFGAIIDKIYKFDKPIVAYRGMRVGLVKAYKAQNEMGLTITEEGGMNEDGIEMVLKTPKSGVSEGYNFDYTIDGPLSVSRSIWITKIYGNLIVKTVIPPTAKKLVITNELAYILQKLEARYFNYRPMNLSTRTEIILFPNQTFNFEVVTTNGDISEELAELHEMFYNLQEDTKEVVAGSENSIGHEAFCDQLMETVSIEGILPFIAEKDYKRITNLAKPCYKPVGQNSWEHIQQVYSQASRICKKLFNRTLTPVEYAACLFHDCSVIDSGKENHNQLSADKAVGILKDLFTPEELNIIHTAIVEHDNQVTSGQWKFSSSASEFVAAGDFNPPDAEWIMNKSYTWGITHGLNHVERIANMTALVKRAYSSTGEMWLHMPNVYKNYFATKINAVKKLFDKITTEEAEKLVMAYRKKHHLSDTDINLPTSSVEALSPNISKKKQLIIGYICSICDIIDPSKLNSKRYHRLLDNMNDKEFDQWMNYVKEGKWRLHIVAPNLIINLKNENLLKAADKAKCKLFHRIWMTDNATGRQYLTDNEYLVLTLPVRRQQQFLDEKMSVPDNDRQIDGMTGQVTGDSRSSSITNPEIQILASRKLDATLEELVNVRGGNMLAYGEFKRQAEETGEINMSMFDPNTRSRVAVVGQVLLNSMHIDANIVE